MGRKVFLRRLVLGYTNEAFSYASLLVDLAPAIRHEEFGGYIAALSIQNKVHPTHLFLPCAYMDNTPPVL